MTTSEHSLDDGCERAALYALGALRGDDARGFEGHLAACEVCRAEVHTFAAVAAELGRASQPETPTAALRARVEALRAKAKVEIFI